MKKIINILFVSFIICSTTKAQNPYPQLLIDSIQFVSPSRLANDSNTLPDYISPTFKNTTYRDTVRFEGVVVSNPQVYGLSTFRKGAYIQRIGGGPWSGVLVMCEPSGTGTTLANLKTETNFYPNFIPGKRVRVTGVIRHFQGETQINLIRNNANYSNAVEQIAPNDTTVTYTEIGVNQLMTGNSLDSNWIAQKLTGERWEGVPVILKNVTVNSVSRFANNLRFNWTVIDEQGNQIEIRDFSGYYRRDGNSDSITLNVVDTNRFTPPPVGTKLNFVRGIVTEYTVNNAQRYAISPIFPGDVSIKSLSINSTQCVFINKPFNLNITQSGLNSDTAYFELATNTNFDTILSTQTINTFSQNTQSIALTTNLPSGNYKGRLRLKNNGLISNAINLIVSNDFSPNFSDTTIAFKKDSILLSAPTGNYTYSWNNGSNSSSIWVNYESTYYLTIQGNTGCSITDSTRVIFVSGIEQTDTTICKGSEVLLSIPSYIPKRNLLGWWPFNGNSLDESGNNNHGLITGAVIGANDRNGNSNHAFYFNYNNQNTGKIAIPHKAEYNLGTGIGKQLSISLWVNEEDLLATSNFQKYGFIFNKGPLGGLSTARDYSILRLSNELYWGTGLQGSNCSWSYISTPPTNKWYHLVVTLNQNTGNSSGTKKIYLDGQLISTCNYTDKNPANADSIYIGGNGFKGKIDDVGIWNRELSNQEVYNLYKSKFNNITWPNNDTTLTTKITPDSTKSYSYQIKIGSYIIMDSLKITVNPLPTINLLDSSIAFKKDSIRLNAIQGYTSYTWNTNDTSDFIWVKSKGTYKVVVKNQYGCTNTDSTRVIFISGISQKDTSICLGKSIVLSTTDSLNSYSWSNNERTKTITVSPTSITKYYLNGELGSFKFNDSIVINTLTPPLKNISFNKLSLCKNDTIILTANPGYNYTWFKNSLAISANRILMVNQPGKYLVHLTDSFGCENTSDTLNIFNAPIPSLNFTINDSIQCALENNFLFEDNSTIDSGSYQRKWVFGNTPQISDSKQTNWSNIGIGVYPIKLIATTNYACSDSLVKNIVVKNNPSIGNMTGDSVGLSTSIPYVYAVSQQPNHSFQWTVTNGIILNGQGTNVITVQWLNNGKGNIKAEIIDIFGCSDTITKNINIGSVGIRDIIKTNKYLIYPNPSNGVFTIEITSDRKDLYSLKLINSLGQIIHTESKEVSEGINKIYLSKELPSGVYKLTIENADSNNHQTIIIK